MLKMEMELPLQRRRLRAQRRLMEVVKEDKESAGVTLEEAGERATRRQMIRGGDPWREQPKDRTAEKRRKEELG